MEQKQQLPNATAVLVLGILSLVLTCFYGLGLVLGIIGVVLGNKGKKLYRSNPEVYLGYGNLNAGWIMSIIGLCLSALYIILIVVFGAAYFAAISSMM
ncbi:MAG: CCC motif membrane protein [Flavobacteriales bacterium]|jgi:hypothetical protein